jgi:hypothetical protein
MSSSVGIFIPFPTEWKKTMFQTTNQISAPTRSPFTISPPLPTTHLGRPIGSKGSQPQRQPTHGSSGLREGRRAELELEKCEKPVGDIMGYMKNEYTNNL